MTPLDKALELSGEIKGKTCEVAKREAKERFIQAWRKLSEEDKMIFKNITATLKV